MGTTDVTGLIDTGACVTILSKHVYTQLKQEASILKEIRSSKRFVAAGRGNTIQSYREILVDVTCGGVHLGTHTCFVLPSDETDILLGGSLARKILESGLADMKYPEKVQYTVGTERKEQVSSSKNIDYVTARSYPVHQSTQRMTGFRDSESAQENSRANVPADHLHTRKITDYPPQAHKDSHLPTEEMLAMAEKKVRELIKEGFVVETTGSKWLIPIHLVKKTNGTWRFCLGLRRLNLLTTQDNYPLPKIATITDDLRDMKYFTKLDIKDGFFRVPLVEETQHKTTFKLGKTCYKFRKKKNKVNKICVSVRIGREKTRMKNLFFGVLWWCSIVEKRRKAEVER
ncbi:uncharacterized protein NEMAJ01_2043 [Nematocida major]|uniref:uncharacterized protein n=1 Tax=Nematocida major TaxID=1912982 RepID=UPI00200897F4|nr:uncharacterized protein NEMAJ01_2043 [Nematocida major]KAH9387147.1 hypothetical protein NEMAJ01_2043 [Nematocida major]